MKKLLIGIDVGSTTTKITVLDAGTETLLYSDYRRHLTIRNHELEGKNPIGAADLEWIFACNYEGTEVTNHLNSDLSDIFILPLLSFSTTPSSTSHSQKIPRDPHPLSLIHI